MLNSERDAPVLFANDTDPAHEDDDVDDEPATAPEAAAAPAAAEAAAPAPAAPTAPAGAPQPDDIPFDAADATMALIALSAKMRIDQIEALDSIESITDGASSRRNQLLVDLGSELDLGAIDGAAEADLAGLKGQVTKLARTYKPYGPVLSDSINDQLRTALGPAGKRPAAIADRVKKTWELGDGWVKHVTVEFALGTREGSSVRGGSLGGLHDGAIADAATVDKVIDAAVAAVAADAVSLLRCHPRPELPAVAWWTPLRSPSSQSRSPAATACWRQRPARSSTSWASTMPSALRRRRPTRS